MQELNSVPSGALTATTGTVNHSVQTPGSRRRLLGFSLEFFLKLFQFKQ